MLKRSDACICTVQTEMVKTVWHYLYTTQKMSKILRKQAKYW